MKTFDIRSRPLILDGGLATELERRGADLRDPLWSAKLLIEDPDAIEAVHRAYFEAGADLAISASYQASFQGFAARGIEPDAAAELMRRSVALAVAARDAFERDPGRDPRGRSGCRRFVAASVGPYGAALADGSEYHGDYGVSRRQLEGFHARRLAVLAGAGADLLAVETIPSLEEAMLLVHLLQELPEARAWISFTCRDEERVAHGESFAECVAAVAASPQVLAVGLNCTAPRFVEPLLMAARRVTDKPLVAYPNRGEHWDAEAHRWVDDDDDDAADGPRRFAALALRWRDAGAHFIGGCCRIGPEYIRALRSALEADGTEPDRRGETAS